jgi:hypothetical protein
MTPQTNRYRVAFDRAVPTRNAGPGRGTEAGEIGGSGGKRMLGSDGQAGRRGLVLGRRCG